MHNDVGTCTEILPQFFLCESQVSTFVVFVIFIVVVIILMICYVILICPFLHYIGPIGAAASRPCTRAQPGEFQVIVHLRLVLLVFVNSSIILT